MATDAPMCRKNGVGASAETGLQRERGDGPLTRGVLARINPRLAIADGVVMPDARIRIGRLALAGAALLVALSLGCAGRPPVEPASVPGSRIPTGGSLAVRAAGIARSMVGAPYRYRGAGPEGFDCSGLVVYSFARAGRVGLPHSVTRLDELSQPVPIGRLRPGDLLFFRLSGSSKSHVGIYLGDRQFVHAPSSGKPVEIVDFDHVYWGPRIRLAGRL